MKLRALSFAAASIAFLPSAAFSAISTLGTVRTYDSDTNLNSVDATGGTSGLALAVFSSSVGTAFDNNLGGVITFDDVAVGTGSTFNVTYGTSGLGTLTISQSIVNFYIDTATALGGVAISGANVMRSSNPATQVYNFSTSLQSLGFTIIARNAPRSGNITLTYSDASSQTFAFSVATATGTAAASATDTFYGFNAPANLGITKLEINPGANNYFAIDDLGFIIPEPSACLLSVGALAGFCLRRRR